MSNSTNGKTSTRTPKRVEYINIITQHCLATLPDSIRERKKLLHALLQELPSTYEPRAGLTLLLDQIENHDQAQRQLISELLP